MDPLQLINDLESLIDKIPTEWRADFESLIASIRTIYEQSIKFITPALPVQDGKQSLASHYTRLDTLQATLSKRSPAFQQVYVGNGSNSYHTTAMSSLQNLQSIRDHLATASQLHNTMAFNFGQASEAQIALGALLVGLGITLGVLVFSAGTTAPVTIPAAVLEAAGGVVTIGLMTEAEAAAAAAILALMWASLPDALLIGTIGAIGTDIILHAPPIHFPNISPNIPTTSGLQGTYFPMHSHQNELPIPGKATGPNVYYPPKNKTIDKAWDNEARGFEDIKGRIWTWDTKHKDHWDVQLKDGSHINVYPDGVERGQRDDGTNKGKKGKK